MSTPLARRLGALERMCLVQRPALSTKVRNAQYVAQMAEFEAAHGKALADMTDDELDQAYAAAVARLTVPDGLTPEQCTAACRAAFDANR